jgi:hypothetical protein
MESSARKCAQFNLKTISFRVIGIFSCVCLFDVISNLRKNWLQLSITDNENISSPRPRCHVDNDVNEIGCVRFQKFSEIGNSTRTQMSDLHSRTHP